MVFLGDRGEPRKLSRLPAQGAAKAEPRQYWRANGPWRPAGRALHLPEGLPPPGAHRC